MKKSEFDAVLESVTRMTDEQRAQLRLALDLLGEEPATTSAFDPDELLWSGYLTCAEQEGLQLPPLSHVRKTSLWSSFAKACRDLDLWVEHHFRPEDETRRRHAFVTVARCIILSLREMNVPLTQRSLLQQARNATQHVDRQYPGYADAGLLKQYAR